jgi:hypothetical protein
MAWTSLTIRRPGSADAVCRRARPPKETAVPRARHETYLPRLFAAALALVWVHVGSAACPGFAPPDTALRVTGAWGILAADVDADTETDLAVTARATNELLILRGRGDGSFEPALRYAAGTDPRSIVAGDLDRDGLLDFVVANTFIASDSIQFFWGRGAGTWDGTFDRGALGGAGDEPTGLALEDLDGDLILDLIATARNDSRLRVWRGTGARDGATAFEPVGSFVTGLRPVAVAVGDFNADEVKDLMSADTEDHRVSVLIGGESGGSWDGTFATGVPYAVGQSPTFVLVSDFDADGALDAATSNAVDDNISVLLGRTTGGVANGTFDPAVHYFVGDSVHSNPRHLVAVDVTGNGILDLLTPNAHTDNLSVLVGNGSSTGDGTFQGTQNFPLGNFPRQIAAADFNHDDRIDLAITDDFDGTVVILLNACDLVPVEMEGLSAVRGETEVRVRGMVSSPEDCRSLRLYRLARARSLVDEIPCALLPGGAFELVDPQPPSERVGYDVVEVSAAGGEYLLGTTWAERLPTALATPNPSRGPVRLDPAELGEGSFTVTIFDAAGRLVSERAIQVTTGAVLLWDGTDRSGLAARSGAYTAVVSGNGRRRFYSFRILQ